MARTVEKILEDDDKKPALVTDEGADETLIEETGPTPEEAAADLRKQLEAANARADREARAREDAETRANNASASAGNAVQAQITTQETAIEGKISLAKTNLESIKAQLKQARQAGDSDAEIDLQDAMTNARYELNTAEWEKKNFAAWKEDQAKRTTKVEASSPYTAKEQAWISSHPEFGTSKKFARVAKSAAADALEEGLKQDSDKYFQYIEDALTEMKLLKPETVDDEPLSGAGASTATAAATGPAPSLTTAPSPR